MCRISAPALHRACCGRWAQTLEGLGFDLLMISDHIAVTPDVAEHRAGRIPVWVGGNSDAGLRRAVRLGEAWHPLRFTMPWLHGALDRLAGFANDQGRPVPRLVPRIALRLAGSPVTGAGRVAGEGTIDQILDDLTQLRRLGTDTVVLDPFNGDPEETSHPDTAWHALAAVLHGVRELEERP